MTENGKFVKGAWIESTEKQATLEKFKTSQVNTYETTTSTVIKKLIRTQIYHDRYVDCYDDDSQDTRYLGKDDIEKFYQEQLKLYNKKGYIKLYVDELIPEEYVPCVTGDGEIIEEESKISKVIRKLKFWQ